MDGVTTWDRDGSDFVATPASLKSMMSTNTGFFSYCSIQNWKQIIQEALWASGSRCWIGLTVANDWKLGMSVDNVEPLAISCL